MKRTDAYSASLVLEGIPEPVSKFVHVINIMYKSDAASEHLQNFVVLKEPKMLLEDLKPGQRYKAWVDAYLTNGKTVSSNILEFHTKPGPPPTTTTTSTTTTTESNEIEDSKAVALHSVHQDGSTAEAYYIALIVVAIVAAVAGLAFAVVLVLLLRRQSTAKAPITRNPSESAYDNPTYKVRSLFLLSNCLIYFVLFFNAVCNIRNVYANPNSIVLDIIALP